MLGSGDIVFFSGRGVLGGLTGSSGLGFYCFRGKGRTEFDI